MDVILYEVCLRKNGQWTYKTNISWTRRKTIHTSHVTNQRFFIGKLRNQIYLQYLSQWKENSFINTRILINKWGNSDLKFHLGKTLSIASVLFLLVQWKILLTAFGIEDSMIICGVFYYLIRVYKWKWKRKEMF